MKIRTLILSAACLLASTAGFAQKTNMDLDRGGAPINFRPRLKLLKKFSFQRNISHDADASSIAFDHGRVYIASPDGLVLTTPALDSYSKLRPIFQPDVKTLSRIYVYDHVVYVLAIRSDSNPASHTFFQSTDRGRSFQAIDNGLYECANGRCYYLNPSVLWAKDNLLFVNAGGGDNLLLSDNDGETFQLLSGFLPEQACYNGTFDINISNRTVLLGGECSVDFPYLKRGVLSEDLMSFEVPPQPVQSPYLGNRKVNAIAHKPGTSLAFAANEGGFLRSVDDGESFEYAFEYPTDAGIYPYAGTILIPRNRKDLVLIGGWDKGGLSPTVGTPYLAYATKDGTVWKDVSYLLRDVKQGIVTQLTEDEQGRMLAVVVDVNNKTVSIFQLEIPR